MKIRGKVTDLYKYVFNDIGNVTMVYSNMKNWGNNSKIKLFQEICMIYERKTRNCLKN